MDRIGPYQVTGEIGRGGMGVILRGIDPVIGRPVALKVMLLKESYDAQQQEELRARLFREAKSAGVLNHPNIVTIYLVGDEDGTPFIAMEFVNGRALETELTKQQPLDHELIVRILHQSASALDYAHAKGIIHRDIKPSNLMLNETDEVKVCDFGIAKGLSSQTTLTQTGMIMGSPSYMSPEQIRGNVGPASDQYSLAVVAYRMLTGQCPFRADTIDSLLLRVMAAMPRPVHELNTRLDGKVSAALERALAKDPGVRYESCTAFSEALAGALRELNRPGESTLSYPISANRTVQPRLLLFAGTLITTAAGAVIGAKYLSTRRGPADVAKLIRPVGPPVVVGRGSAAPVLPAVDDFSATPLEIRPGQATELRWKVREADQIKISGIAGNLPREGSQIIYPRKSEEFVLTANGPNGSVARSIQVKVIPGSVNPTSSPLIGRTGETPSPAVPPSSPSLPPLPPAPVIESFTTSQSTIQSGQVAVLKWDVRSAIEVSIAAIGLHLPAQGSHPVCPTESKTYMLEASGPGGTMTRLLTINVTIAAGKNVKMNEFRADPSSISDGEASVLRWAVENASAVWIDPEIGRVDACGVLTVRPHVTTKYQLSYQNDRGTLRSKPVEVVVDGKP